jgi:hypothetical protein
LEIPVLHKLYMFFYRWLAFFRPVKGWKMRYLQFKAGKNVWEVPDRPTVPKVVPFPVEWVPYRLSTAADPPEVQARGFEFLDVKCAETGQDAAKGTAVSCLRCGIPLHPTAAHMVSGFDPPYCKRCHWPILLTGR